MAKTINLTYKGTDYTLEYTRKSIEQMEKQGFVVTDVDIRPMTTLPELFKGAFLAHHRFVKDDLIDEIYLHIKDKYLLIQKLAEMYSETLMVLVDEPENDEGNVEWGADW